MEKNSDEIKKDDFLYMGRESKIYPLAKIIYPQNLFLDDFAIIDDFCFILASKFIKIGKYSHMAPYSMITGGGEVYIEDFVEISYGAKIISGTDDIFGEYLFTPSIPEEFRNVNRDRVTIGRFSFIGANSIVYPGVRIGEGVIVNPGTIVKQNLKSWGIYEGPDARLIGKRKYKDQIIKKAEALLKKI
ncbi:acyltransferase [Calditrichota bacterium GD2]